MATIVFRQGTARQGTAELVLPATLAPIEDPDLVGTRSGSISGTRSGAVPNRAATGAKSILALATEALLFELPHRLWLPRLGAFGKAQITKFFLTL